MCRTPGEAYAWIGSILVHLSFVTIILWSATCSDQDKGVTLKVGFVCSVVYAAILFGLAQWLEGKCNNEPEEDSANHQSLEPLLARGSTDEAPSSMHGNTTSRGLRGKHLFVSLLYGAAVLALGAPGCFVVLQAISCCHSDSQLRRRDAAMLGIVSLPITIISAWLWNRKRLSSMIATGLIGVSLVLRNLCVLIDPHMDLVAVGTFLVGAIAVLYLSRFSLVIVPRYSTDQKLVNIGLTFSALVYFYGACEIFLPNLDGHEERIWHLTGATVLCFLPLAFLGVGTNCVPLPILGALGLFLDAMYLSNYLSNKWPGYNVPIQAAVLAITGLAIGSLGLVLDGFKVEIKLFLEKCFACFLGVEPADGDGGVEDSPANEEEVHTITDDATHQVSSREVV